MRDRLRRLVAAAPADTWFFLGVSAFAAVLMAAYWLWTYEWAGTILLLGFAIASGLNGLRLLLAHPPRRAAAPLSSRRPLGTDALAPPAGVPTREPALGAPDPDRPFLDERGRLPAPSIAPLAIALAAALITTSIVLGPWLLIIAVLPLAWGAIGWLRDAGAEFDAVDAADAPRDGRESAPSDGPAVASSPAQGPPGRLEAPGDEPSRA